MGPKYHLSVITGEKHFQNDKKTYEWVSTINYDTLVPFSCRAPDAFKFDIIVCQWYQSIRMYPSNPFIYGFYHFGSVSDPLLMRNGILDPFWGPK